MIQIHSNLLVSFLILFFFSTTPKVEDYKISDSSNISINENETDSAYKFECTFSNDYSEGIRRAILEEFPDFNLKSMSIDRNNYILTIKLKKKKLEMSYILNKGEKTNDLKTLKNIANKIRELES